MKFAKAFCILSSIFTMTVNIFHTVDLLYAVMTMLMAIFLAIEDRKKIHIHIHGVVKDDLQC